MEAAAVSETSNFYQARSLTFYKTVFIIKRHLQNIGSEENVGAFIKNILL